MNYGERIRYLTPSKKDQNLETQVQQLELEGIARKNIFVDKQVTGKTSVFDRPALSEMLHYIKTYNFSTLFVYELSQIGRSFLNTLEIVQKLETEFHVIVRSLPPRETWTQTTDRSIRTLILAIFTWVVELGRESVSERTKKGLAKARNEGKSFGHLFKELTGKLLTNAERRAFRGLPSLAYLISRIPRFYEREIEDLEKLI